MYAHSADAAHRAYRLVVSSYLERGDGGEWSRWRAAEAAEEEAALPKKPHGRLELTWMGKDLALIPYEDGKYDYAWVEPNDPRVTEVRSIERTDIVGQVEASYDEAGRMVAAGAEDNLVIVGDSGDALRALGTIPEYADRYQGQVKLVYIDPPFNTQKIFDDYSDQMEHSVWLTFMRDRIRDIKPLLSREATLWVHLDDAEVHRMRVLLDEEFGAECFLGTVIWQKADGPRNEIPNFSVDHDMILVYGATTSAELLRRERDLSLNAIYSSVDGDPRPWYDDNPTAPSAERNQTWVYAVQNPITGELVYPAKGRCWGARQETLFESLSEYAKFKLEVIDDDDERAEVAGVPVAELRKGVPAILLDEPLESARESVAKRRAAGIWPEFILRPKGTLGRKRVQPDSGMNVRTLWLNKDVRHNREAKSEIKRVLPGRKPFKTPKPERLLQRVIESSTRPGDIVLDCFAGSGTTAAVAQKLGRRWVTVELLEKTAETYIVPRLAKVVDGSDKGGISFRTERVPAAGVELPAGMSPEQARVFSSALTKVTADLDITVDVVSETARYARAARKGGGSGLSDEELATLARLAAKLAKTSTTGIDITAKALAPLRAATKTREETTICWSGGGGFTIARIGPSMYDVEDGPEGRTEVFLSPAATNGAWSAAVSGQLGYRRTADHPVFVGQKGRERLAVIDGVADEFVIRDLHAHLAPGETMLVVAKASLDDTSALLRELAPGSTLRVAPGGLLQKGSVLR